MMIIETLHVRHDGHQDFKVQSAECRVQSDCFTNESMKSISVIRRGFFG